jgi:two-component system, cell cycle response regulator
MRTADWIARYGGEEFVIVLPETNVSNAAIAAEHLRKYIAEQPCNVAGQELSVSASFGVSGWRDKVPQGATLDTLMARCDSGVYASKAAGRNRITTESLD